MKIKFVLPVLAISIICFILLSALWLTGCSANDSWDTIIFVDTANISNLASANIVGGTIILTQIKSGVNQSASGAIVGELWIDTSDNNTIKVGQ